MMKRVTATRRLEWDSAHRVLRHESKCASIHGHRYAAEFECEAAELDSVGRVIDFGHVKEVVGKWIDDNLDHTALVNSEDRAFLQLVDMEHQLDPEMRRAPFIFESKEPTAENIASMLIDTANLLLSGACAGIKVVRVRVWETPNCYAEVKL